MEKNALCFSLFGSQVAAVSLRAGSVTGVWRSPELLKDLAGFGAAIERAASETNCSSRRVALVLAHPRLSQQTVEVPPAKGRALERFLDRRVHGLKAFEDVAAWSCQPALPTKTANAVILHLLPQPVLDQLAQLCAATGRALVRVIPATSVLSSHLKELPIEDSEVVLLAASTGPFTSVVVGRRNGQICHARLLPMTWAADANRLALDLNRTIGYVSQQSGLTVSGVWLFGGGAEQQAPQLTTLLRVPVRISPVAYTPTYWAEQAGRLPDRDDGNLISVEARRAPQQRRLLVASLIILLLILLSSAAVAAFFEMQRRNALQSIARTEAETAQVQQRIGSFTARQSQLAEKKDIIRHLGSGRMPAIPWWFLGYLSEAVPDDLVLTEVRVIRTNEQWSVHVDGALHPTTNQSPATILHQAVSTLSTGLARGPFQIQIRNTVVESNRPGMLFHIQGVVP